MYSLRSNVISFISGAAAVTLLEEEEEEFEFNLLLLLPDRLLDLFDEELLVRRAFEADRLAVPVVKLPRRLRFISGTLDYGSYSKSDD